MTTLLLVMLIAGRQMLKLKTKTSFLSIFFGSIFKRAFFRPVAGEISFGRGQEIGIHPPPQLATDATRLEILMRWRGGLCKLGWRTRLLSPIAMWWNAAAHDSSVLLCEACTIFLYFSASLDLPSSSFPPYPVPLLHVLAGAACFDALRLASFLARLLCCPSSFALISSSFRSVSSIRSRAMRFSSAWSGLGGEGSVSGPSSAITTAAIASTGKVSRWL